MQNGAAFINKEENRQISEAPDASGTANDHDRFGTGEKDETNTWSAANQEAQALLYLNNVSCLPIQGHCKADQSCKLVLFFSVGCERFFGFLMDVIDLETSTSSFNFVL